MKKTTKTMQKLLLVLLSCLLLAVPALAAETPADGTYTVELTMSGGTGKASIASPVDIVVEDGSITATVVWSSSNYDRMTVDGVDYEPTTTEDGSTFEIPIVLDEDMVVMAETLAMSEPHDIEYILYFDSETLEEVSEGVTISSTMVDAGGAIIILLIIVIAQRMRRDRSTRRAKR
ncbi:MAG: hypothetical protein LUG17_01125 [Clostridiales bacterium]|nr:hypothetical protein [Clostridiales bacterium]